MSLPQRDWIKGRVLAYPCLDFRFLSLNHWETLTSSGSFSVFTRIIICTCLHFLLYSGKRSELLSREKVLRLGLTYALCFKLRSRKQIHDTFHQVFPTSTGSVTPRRLKLRLKTVVAPPQGNIGPGSRCAEVAFNPPSLQILCFAQRAPTTLHRFIAYSYACQCGLVGPIGLQISVIACYPQIYQDPTTKDDLGGIGIRPQLESFKL